MKIQSHRIQISQIILRNLVVQWPDQINNFFIKANTQHNIMENGLTVCAVTSAPSGNEVDNTCFSSMATSKFSRRCIIDGNRDTELPISFEKPTTFSSQSSGGRLIKYSSSCCASVLIENENLIDQIIWHTDRCKKNSDEFKVKQKALHHK